VQSAFPRAGKAVFYSWLWGMGSIPCSAGGAGMARALYALLVGIDKYRGPVSQLDGCVNDIECVETLLRGLAGRGDFDLRLVRLTNEQALRAAVIRQFREHLGQAGADDVALFYYCGHGSQEKAPPELWHLEPDRLNETLVCHDSRGGDNWDLADKELAFLISDVARTGCHVLCVFDCCHSGSGTRDAADEQHGIRHAPAHLRERPLATFLDGDLAARLKQGDAAAPGGWIAWPTGRHILLAACRANETAKEVIAGGVPRGAFTVALLAALEQAQGRIGYHDLIKRVESEVRRVASQQVPRAEATDPTDLLKGFLGCPAAADRLAFTLRYDTQMGWVVDAGAIHGVTWPRGADTAWFAITAIAADAAVSSGVQAYARVAAVRPELSQVEIAQGPPPGLPTAQAGDGMLDPGTTYHATLVSTPRPPVAVRVGGDAQATAALRAAFAARDDWSAMVREGEAADATIEATAAGGVYRIRHVSPRRSAAANDDVAEVADAARAAALIAHLARWELVAGIDNPGSLLGPQAVQIVVHLPVATNGAESWTEANATAGLRLVYRQVGGNWQKPRLRLALRNDTDHDLYCALVWLGEDHSISSILMPGGAEFIPAKRLFALHNGRDIYASIPDDKWQAGRTEVRDVLKLFVSTEPFDPTLFDQPAWRSVATRGTGRPPRNVLGWLTARTRAFSLTPTETFPEWATHELRAAVMRPAEGADARPGGRHGQETMP